MEEFTGIIKDWFIAKNLDQNERYILQVGESYISRETEKALQIEVQSDFGSVKFWVPKSCLMTEEDWAHERKAEAKREASKTNGLAYNEMLVEFAKANGIAGIRKRMKTSTLISKIKGAGLEVPARAIA